MIRIVAIIVVTLCGLSASLHETPLEPDGGLDGTESAGLLVDQEGEGRNSTNTIGEGLGEDFGALETNSNEPAQGDQETTNANNTNSIDFIDDVAVNVTDFGTSGGFLNGFFSALGIILINEIMDKTFIIAMVLAMHNPRLVVFAGAWSALALMTIAGAVIGMLAHFVPEWIIVYATAVVMVFFGLKMMFDAYRMTEQRGEEEYQQVEKEVRQPSAFRVLLKIFSKAFALTFLAEFGDRSQAATVLLAATDNVLGVMLGGMAGHAFCTGTAVLGGKLVARYVNLRKVTFIGGAVFMIFAALSIIFYNLPNTSA
ncbi:hypothetical protein PRIPAC_97549 [Pristionchus pacificus]|uniref:GDT1 family protein n=1 Tax=Pristionchus pacificus TaxID=54126 RepID=A0A2A6BCT8_PRIPA|nr:hypothetical protein PRIPAC_97549 [Pristionchus pacificus]|eukprot:PDM63702.1 hypothetical protein PRIPAC_49675 [Pristionchus pacificus]